MNNLLNSGLSDMINLVKMFHSVPKFNSPVKIFFLILLILTFLPAIFAACKVYGMDMTVGATSWYAWGKQYNSQKDNVDEYNSIVESDPSLLYGPAISLKFNDDFNLTFVFLYGRFESEKSEFKRIDSDLALNYKLSDYFKVFAGIKYLSYGVIPLGENFWGAHDFRITDIDTHTSYGTGLGVSATVPIIDNLFGLATVSGLYLFGNQKIDMYKIKFEGSPVEERKEPHNLKIGYHEYGFNTNLSVAYYIADWSTVISLGGRFQYIIADYKSNDIYLESVRFMIYGVTLTATYTFSL